MTKKRAQKRSYQNRADASKNRLLKVENPTEQAERRGNETPGNRDGHAAAANRGRDFPQPIAWHVTKLVPNGFVGIGASGGCRRFCVQLKVSDFVP